MALETQVAELKANNDREHQKFVMSIHNNKVQCERGKYKVLIKLEFRWRADSKAVARGQHETSKELVTELCRNFRASCELRHD
jgi:hypothetical protein